MEPTVVWADGDPFRDLTDEIETLGAATIVTEHGTATLLDAHRRRHRRVPLEGGHRLPRDLTWNRFDSFRLTPCGLRLWHPSTGAQTSRLVLVLAGVVHDWLEETEVGQRAVEAILARLPPSSPGHPPHPCGALHCVRNGDDPHD